MANNRSSDLERSAFDRSETEREFILRPLAIDCISILSGCTLLAPPGAFPEPLAPDVRSMKSPNGDPPAKNTNRCCGCDDESFSSLDDGVEAEVVRVGAALRGVYLDGDFVGDAASEEVVDCLTGLVADDGPEEEAANRDGTAPGAPEPDGDRNDLNLRGGVFFGVVGRSVTDLGRFGFDFETFLAEYFGS